jgi:hypothetical protein
MSTETACLANAATWASSESMPPRCQELALVRVSQALLFLFFVSECRPNFHFLTLEKKRTFIRSPRTHKAAQAGSRKQASVVRPSLITRRMMSQQSRRSRRLALARPPLLLLLLCCTLKEGGASEERLIGWLGEVERPGALRGASSDAVSDVAGGGGGGGKDRTQWIEQISTAPRAYVWHGFMVGFTS